MSKFKVGDRVILSDRRPYLNKGQGIRPDRSKILGTIMESSGSSHPYSVTFDERDEYGVTANSYNESDLELIEITEEVQPVIDAEINELVITQEVKLNKDGTPRKSRTKKADHVQVNIADDDNAKVPTIQGQAKLKSHLEVAIRRNMPALLIGDTGTGKTSVVKELAQTHGKDSIRFNLTGETTVDEFVGKYTLTGGQTVWEDGILLTAMKKGIWLIVDEINVALPEILFVLHSLLDDEKAVMVSNHLGEVVKPHVDFRFFGTMNPVDEYAGTKDLNKAFKSRFGMVLTLQYPPRDTEVNILSSRTGVDKQLASQMVDVAVSIRKAKDENKVFYTCSTRDLLQWGELVDELGLVDSFEVSIMNKAEGDATQVNKIFKDISGKYVNSKKQGFELNIDKLILIAERLDKERKVFEGSKQSVRELARKELLESLLGPEEAARKRAEMKASGEIEGEVMERAVPIEDMPF